jgi:hypothetical protein
MNTILMILSTIFTILGVIFLIVISVIVAFFLLAWLWIQLWAKRLLATSSEGKVNLQRPMNSDFLEIFYGVPVFGHLLKNLIAYMRNGIDYFNDAIPLIIANWNSQELVKRSTPEFLNSLEAGEPEKSFDDYFYIFGKLKKFKGITTISGDDYIAEAVFDKGLAKIQVQILQDNNQFLINNFKVDSLEKLLTPNQ